MTLSRSTSGRILRAPKALLLDFGGVVVETSRVPDWESALAAHVHRLILDAAASGPGVPSREQVADDIKAGCIADSHWKNAMSRLYAPRELRYEEFWGDFVAADWPAAAREAVVAEAAELCRLMGEMRSRREVRDGIPDLLDAADAAGIPVGIVSNALAGAVHLEFLAAHGMTERFAVEIHSDAVRIRKPNPEMILLALRKLGVAPDGAWYVGDNFDRDVLCGWRAGIGGNILMEARDTYDLPYDLRQKPDAIVSGPRDLLALFTQSLRERAA